MNAPSKKPFRCATVAVLGRPNAGKSTLLNALVGTNFSGVSKRPQTTRTNIRGILQHYTGEGARRKWSGQIVVVDTPGVNFKKGLLERAMYMAVENAVEEVDVVLWVSDAKSWARDLADLERKRPGSDKLPGWLRNRLDKKSQSRWILVLSKSDLGEKNELLPLIEKTAKLVPEFSDIVPVAAMIAGAKSNLEGLKEVLLAAAPEGDPLYPEDYWTDLNERQLIQNLVREAIFRQAREEVPYLSDCSLLKYTEPGEGRRMPEVDVNIWVSKASLKAILVGRAGSRIKEIGKAVRERYKEITGDEIVVRTFVKVVEKWESRAANLEELGYVLA